MHARCLPSVSVPSVGTSRRSLVLAASLVGLAWLCTAAPASAEGVDLQVLVITRMQRFVEDNDIPGAIAIVGRHDRLLCRAAIGQRDIEKKTPMTHDTLFRIASMTKPITAMGIMILAEEGKLSVQDPVEKHLPEFRDLKLATKGDRGVVKIKDPARKITIRDLLTHTSGLAGGIPPGNLYMKRDKTLAEATTELAKQPLQFEPGSRWAYCNMGIDTLGRIIEVVSGTPYEKFIGDRIFKPLGMTNTAFYPDDAQRGRLAQLYDSKQGKLVPVGFQLLGPTENAKHPIPAGGLYSTGDDLVRICQMMLCGGQYHDTRILSEKTVREMTTVQTGELDCGFVPGMGFGLGVGVVRQPVGVTEMLSPGTFGHGGAFGTQYWMDPKQDLFVILLIARVALSNGDNSMMRRELQRLAVEAVK